MELFKFPFIVIGVFSPVRYNLNNILEGFIKRLYLQDSSKVDIFRVMVRVTLSFQKLKNELQNKNGSAPKRVDRKSCVPHFTR